MKLINTILVLVVFNIYLTAQDRSIYIWETPVAYNVNAPQQMINELRKEIDTLFKYNAMAPLRVFYGDIIWESYFSYLEPSRSVLTLARAYNHLTPAQRLNVKQYIREELSNPISTPWTRTSTQILSRTDGKRREYHLLDQVWGSNNISDIDNRPVLHLLYGIWLYSFNSKDNSIIQENWTKIKQYYQAFKSRELKLPSGIGAAIAVARMSLIMNDTQTYQTALNDINNSLAFQGLIESAKNFAYNGNQGWDAPYPYNTDRQRKLIFMGWIYLNISPELCRFLDDYYHQQVVTEHQSEVKKFPYWWVRSVPYFSRWTGDESVGLSSEVCGMASPIERWLLKKDANSFSLYTRSVPYCIGDSHWLEMLIDNIELYGQTQWVDVRNYNDSIPPNSVTDLQIEYHNSSAYLIWTTPSDNGLNGRPFNYWFRYSKDPIDNNQWNQYQIIPYNKTIKSAGESDTLKLPELGSDPLYYIAVKSSDDFNNISSISNIITLDNSMVSVDDKQKPTGFFVYDNFPNPFNPQTNIRFSLPSASTVSINIFSSIGELITKLADNEIYNSGEHNLKWNAQSFPSGVYLINITIKENSSSKLSFKTIKSVLLK